MDSRDWIIETYRGVSIELLRSERTLYVYLSPYNTIVILIDSITVSYAVHIFVI
jgi:hypothetical protein